MVVNLEAILIFEAFFIFEVILIFNRFPFWGQTYSNVYRVAPQIKIGPCNLKIFRKNWAQLYKMGICVEQ